MNEEQKEQKTEEMFADTDLLDSDSDEAAAIREQMRLMREEMKEL